MDAPFLFLAAINLLGLLMVAYGVFRTSVAEEDVGWYPDRWIK